MIFTLNITYVSSSEANVKPAEEEAGEPATISAPTKPHFESHQTAAEVNGFTSPSDETPPPPESLAQIGPALFPNSLPVETATTTQAPMQSPSSVQDGQHPEKPAVSSQDMIQTQPQADAEHLQCVTTNGVSLDSTETSVITPSSLTDLDLIEAVLDDVSSAVSETLMPENPASSFESPQTENSPLTNTENVTQCSESNLIKSENGETSDKTASHLTKTPLKGGKEHKLIIVKTLCHDKVVTHKHVDTNISEGIEEWDVLDGLRSDDPSVSEAAPPSQEPEPKKRESFFKRNKKKNNQGNLICFNKVHILNASPMISFAFIPFYFIEQLFQCVHFNDFASDLSAIVRRD